MSNAGEEVVGFGMKPDVVFMVIGRRRSREGALLCLEMNGPFPTSLVDISCFVLREKSSHGTV